MADPRIEQLKREVARAGLSDQLRLEILEDLEHRVQHCGLALFAPDVLDLMEIRLRTILDLIEKGRRQQRERERVVSEARQRVGSSRYQELVEQHRRTEADGRARQLPPEEDV